MRYDYLIAGAGLYGCVFAREMTDAGKRCLVLDRRSHIGGNIYCQEVEGIRVHRYGAHIFHTRDEEVWQYARRFVTFNHYVNAPVARYHDELYNLPFNMNTFSRLWNVATPQEARAIIDEQTRPYRDIEPRNLEEQALKLVGRDIYEKLVREYTEKQWGRPCDELPAFIIKRLPLRFIYDNNYFDDPHQGIPTEGYNALAEKLLEGSDVLLETDYFDWIGQHPDVADRTVFTGPIDAFYGYRFGRLQYRTVTFEEEVLDCENYQGNAVVNYTSAEVPYTRVIEHKHFEFGRQAKTVISREYSREWREGMEPYYPINDAVNQRLYERYRALADEEKNVIFGGRLGNYRYYNMDQVIREALDAARAELAL